MLLLWCHAILHLDSFHLCGGYLRPWVLICWHEHTGLKLETARSEERERHLYSGSLGGDCRREWEWGLWTYLSLRRSGQSKRLFHGQL
jgi:hypothetical protein